MASLEDFSGNPNVNSDEQSQRRARSAFQIIAPSAPTTVCDAWVYACVCTGINPLHVGISGKKNHIPMAFVVYYENNNSDAFGNSLDSALLVCAMILYRLNNPFHEINSQIIPEFAQREQIFYKAFLEILSDYGSKNA